MPVYPALLGAMPKEMVTDFIQFAGIWMLRNKSVFEQLGIPDDIKWSWTFCGASILTLNSLWAMCNNIMSRSTGNRSHYKIVNVSQLSTYKTRANDYLAMMEWIWNWDVGIHFRNNSEQVPGLTWLVSNYKRLLKKLEGNVVCNTWNNNDDRKWFQCLTLLVVIILCQKFLNLLPKQTWVNTFAAYVWFDRQFKNHWLMIIITRRIVIIVALMSHILLCVFTMYRNYWKNLR